MRSVTATPADSPTGNGPEDSCRHDGKSRVTGDCHARFRGSRGVRFPPATRHLHRRRSVIVRTTENGEVLETVRIVNDVQRLASVMARAGECPEVVLEATYGATARNAGRSGLPHRRIRRCDACRTVGERRNDACRPPARIKHLSAFVSCRDMDL
jgi:hypothetical protein